jgi:hypothetical protein
MPLKPLDPIPQEDLCPGWSVNALESGHSPEGLKAHLILMNGTAKHSKTLNVGDDAAQQALADIYAKYTGLDAGDVLTMLLQFIIKIESATRARDAKKPSLPKEQDYQEDHEGLWLVQQTPQGSTRQQLANFSATILADIVEDDGTPDTKRFYDIEARYGRTYASVRVAAKDFHTMTWVAETLGAKAHLIPGAFLKEHTAAAIQDLSEGIEQRHTYVHTGWRQIAGVWHYLHGAGAITAAGAADDVLVSLSETLARYQLPAPPIDDARREALRASLALREVAANHTMIPIVGTAYLAPLRTLLAGEPPDLTTWVVGPSGQFKSEYAALALAHFGDFTRLTLPASFTATGNGLERLCHALQDCLLVVDDFYPAGDRKHAEAMNHTASRLLRGIGNQAGRQRMRQDTSMRSELPPRCIVLATGERLPEGHSTNARIFLVTVPKLQEDEKPAWAQKLSEAQATREDLPLAMAAYLQWIAEHWDELAKDVPARFHALRTAAFQDGAHAREPGQVAYLQLGWEMFTRCAVDAGALTPPERDTVLEETQTHLHGVASEHSQILQAETTVSRFLALLRDGFASKQIYLRNTKDTTPARATAWGWTEEMEYDRSVGGNVPVFHPKQATLIGYVDDEHLFLLPEATYRYLQHASQKANRTWPVDKTTLLRELDDATLIRTQGGDTTRLYREVLKKIDGHPKRCIWLKRTALDETQEDGPDNASPDDREPGMEDDIAPETPVTLDEESYEDEIPF